MKFDDVIVQAENFGWSGDIYKKYQIYKLIHEKNLVSEIVERTGNVGESLRNIFVDNIKKIFAENDFEIKNYQPTVKTDSLAEFDNISDAEKIADLLINHYKKFGYGDISTFKAFRWDKKLVAIKNFENILLSDLIGYDHQKNLLIQNTAAFLENKPANNVLLVGARGTGKSSGVKALVNEYFSEGLRLVQITQPQLKKISNIMDELRNFPRKKFIIFLDDLSFEETEPDYKYLKSAIEGGVESQPENILIYATSNRRHLLRESDIDERYDSDNVNEKISLSDRFGLIIHYYEPTQSEYLEIIRHMLEKKNISLDDETLRIEGHRWEILHSGRNGRIAQQFVKYFLGTR